MHFIDENFWVGISFLIFLYFAYRPVKKAIINSLDSRIRDIKETLSQAEKLKNEAKLLLEQTEQEVRYFEEYKQQALSSAVQSTERLVEAKTKEMENALTRKSDLVKNLIENEKTKAFNKLKDEFTNNVISLVTSYLKESKNNNISNEEIINKLFDKKELKK